MKDAKERSTIVLNRMFAGDYLSNHIGHEVINLFKSDNGRNYVYIQPYGTYSKEHYGKIGYVLFVRGVEGKRAMEVLGLATDLKDLFNPHECTPWEFTRQLICTNNINYGGVSLLDIFVHKKGDPDAQNVYITMEAGYVMRPTKPTYIIYGTNNTIIDTEAHVVHLIHTAQAKSSLKQYFTQEADDYKVLQELINDKSLWTIPTCQIENVDKISSMEVNFFDICRIDDYELAFSNAFAYYMEKYPELVVEFAQKVLNKTTSPFMIVERETNNVDILLENDQQIVVIENKITSKINGVQVVDNNHAGSQLSRYYEYAVMRAKGKKKVSCYILTPNYNPINRSEYNLPDFNCEQIYQQVFYKQVYEFLKGKHQEDTYFQEFIKGLEKHTKEYHDDLFEETLTKFAKQIKQVKSNNN